MIRNGATSYEASYDIGWQDENGDELDGNHAYGFTLDPPSQVKNRKLSGPR